MTTLLRPGVALLLLCAVSGLGDVRPDKVLTGQAAFVSSNTVKPGLFRKVTVDSLPKPFATESATTKSRIVPRPEGTVPQAPAGFQVNLFATGLTEPRVIRVAPNGDIFVVETRAGQVRVFRGIDAKTVAGPEPGREHPEVLKVRAGITGRFESVLFEDVRDVIGSHPQLR